MSYPISPSSVQKNAQSIGFYIFASLLCLAGAGLFAVLNFPFHSAPTPTYFLLSSNGGDDSPWINTGVYLQAGQAFQTIASGKVNLAIHRMIEAAKDDSLPPLPWTGANGLDLGKAYPPRTYREEEGERLRYRIAPHLNLGRVIGVVSDVTPPNKPAAGEILDIGEKSPRLTATTSGNLWLTVNEIWFTPDMVEAYRSSQNTETYTTEFKTKIRDQSYFNVWYDDNSGSFFVTIELTE